MQLGEISWVRRAAFVKEDDAACYSHRHEQKPSRKVEERRKAMPTRSKVGLCIHEPSPRSQVEAANWPGPYSCPVLQPHCCQGHFELLGSFLQDNNIPLENVYNMDEKGLQLEGGRRLNGS